MPIAESMHGFHTEISQEIISHNKNLHIGLITKPVQECVELSIV